MATVTPNYSWPVPTSSDYVKDGASAIEALGDAIDATVFGLPTAGLTLVKSQVIGSGVSTVAVTSAFSTTYENYLIQISGSSASAGGAELRMTLNNSAGSTYQYAGNNISYAASNTFVGGNGAAFWLIGTTGQTGTTNTNIQVFTPFLTAFVW